MAREEDIVSHLDHQAEHLPQTQVMALLREETCIMCKTATFLLFGGQTQEGAAAT